MTSIITTGSTRGYILFLQDSLLHCFRLPASVGTAFAPHAPQNFAVLCHSSSARACPAMASSPMASLSLQSVATMSVLKSTNADPSSAPPALAPSPSPTSTAQYAAASLPSPSPCAPRKTKASGGTPGTREGESHARRQAGAADEGGGSGDRASGRPRRKGRILDR
uniref:Uncharacterized protein n=1 Tax=Arundo donax TaxID=35708 RepID=A0A0A8XNQ8_ARUDO